MGTSQSSPARGKSGSVSDMINGYDGVLCCSAREKPKMQVNGDGRLSPTKQYSPNGKSEPASPWGRALTFRDRRQSGRQLVQGLLKFLLVASLPALANIGLASGFYALIQEHAVLAQLAGIVVVYIWNYAASSRFVWNTP